MSDNWFTRLFRKPNYKIISESTWINQDPIYSGTNFESLVMHGWRKNELIFACISKTANTSAQVALKFYRDRDGEEMLGHPVKRLIQRPNPRMSEFDLWAAIIIYLKLAGVAYFEKERSRSGQVVALWPLRPDWIKEIPSGKTTSAYEYQPTGGVDKVLLDPNDVMSFSLFDPLGMFNHWPPVAVAARTGDIDNATTDFIKSFMQQGGTPTGILKTIQRIDDAEIDRIRSRWRKRYGGSEHWLEPAVLDADASYQQIGSSFKDMGFDVLDARNEARICMVLDVPPIIVNAKLGMDRSTYSNYKEARTAWWEDTLVPQYYNLEDTIINQLLTEFEPGITCDWDFSRVSALQEDRNSRWQRATVAWNAGGITMNEFRAEIGMPERPDGDIFKSAPAPVILPEPEKEPEEEEPEEGEKAYKAKSPPDEKTRQRHEKIIQAAMETYFVNQVGRIEKEVRNNGH